MRSYSEIDTIVKRSTKAKGFSWGVAEEIGKNIKQLELFGSVLWLVLMMLTLYFLNTR